MCGECNWPKGEWVEIPDENLNKRGLKQEVYIPDNYPGPIAIDATVKKKKEEI